VLLVLEPHLAVISLQGGGGAQSAAQALPVHRMVCGAAGVLQAATAGSRIRQPRRAEPRDRPRRPTLICLRSFLGRLRLAIQSLTWVSFSLKLAALRASAVTCSSREVGQGWRWGAGTGGEGAVAHGLGEQTRAALGCGSWVAGRERSFWALFAWKVAVMLPMLSAVPSPPLLPPLLGR
jgi:hypothetical protein